MTRREMQKRLRRARRWAFAGVAGIGALCAGVLIVFGLLLLPYEPLTVYDYRVEPEEVCPNDLMQAYLDREIPEGVDLRSLRVETGWQAVDVPGVTGEPEIAQAEIMVRPPDVALDTGRIEVKSRVPRTAPEMPGTWRATSELTIRGREYGVPHVQEARAEAEELTVVLEPEDPACQ